MGQEEKNEDLNLQRFRCPYTKCGKTWPRRSDEVPAKCAKCQRRLRGKFRLDQILASSAETKESEPSADVGKPLSTNKGKASLREIPGGSTLSKSLQELVPKLERLLARPDTRSALKVIVNNMIPADREVGIGTKAGKGRGSGQH